jgi:hypothetical protein
METIKKTVRVTIEKEIEIELMPSVFGGMTEGEYLEEFRKGLWDVEGIDDVVKYAARMAAIGCAGYSLDGIGLLGEHDSTFPRIPDVKFREISDDCEEEILTA